MTRVSLKQKLFPVTLPEHDMSFSYNGNFFSLSCLSLSQVYDMGYGYIPEHIIIIMTQGWLGYFVLFQILL